MKIALVTLHADTARGGAERYTVDLAASLTRRGHAVSLLASAFQASDTAGERVHLRASGTTRTAQYTSFLNSLDAHLADVSYDIVHAMLPVRRCHVYHPHAGIAAQAVSAGHLNKSGHIRQAVAWLGNRANLRRQRFAAVERRLLDSATPPTVLCLSNLIRQIVKRHFPKLPEAKLAALFNGIDQNRFDPSNYPAARNEIRTRYQIADSAVVGLMLAQDFERKGLRQAIAALAAADRRLLLVVGGKPDPSNYRRLARTLKVDDRVIFVGPVHVPRDFYQAADFFILPTRFDPCSLVVLEALAMGLPVISTIQNGACEVMQDGVHGRVLYDPYNITDLATAMSAMADPSRRSAMAAAILDIRPSLSQEKHVEHLEAIYQAIIKPNAGIGIGMNRS